MADDKTPRPFLTTLKGEPLDLKKLVPGDRIKVLAFNGQYRTVQVADPKSLEEKNVEKDP